MFVSNLGFKPKNKRSLSDINFLLAAAISSFISNSFWIAFFRSSPMSLPSRLKYVSDMFIFNASASAKAPVFPNLLPPRPKAISDVFFVFLKEAFH